MKSKLSRTNNLLLTFQADLIFLFFFPSLWNGEVARLASAHAKTNFSAVVFWFRFFFFSKKPFTSRQVCESRGEALGWTPQPVWDSVKWRPARVERRKCGASREISIRLKTQSFSSAAVKIINPFIWQYYTNPPAWLEPTQWHSRQRAKSSVVVHAGIFVYFRFWFFWFSFLVPCHSASFTSACPQNINLCMAAVPASGRSTTVEEIVN